MFLINYQYFLELRYFFVKFLTHYKKDLKHAITMPSHQGYWILFDIYIYIYIYIYMAL